jgi:hypothetical protein
MYPQIHPLPAIRIEMAHMLAARYNFSYLTPKILARLSAHRTPEAGPPHHSKSSLFTRAGLAAALQQAKSSSTPAISVDIFIAQVVATLFSMQSPMDLREKTSIYVCT